MKAFYDTFSAMEKHDMGESSVPAYIYHCHF